MRALARLYRRRIPKEQIFTAELADTMGALAAEIGREIAILANRRGQVVDVVVGDAQSVTLPAVRKREAESRLSGLRCVQIRLSGGGFARPDLVQLALRRLDLVCAIAWEPGGIWASEVFVAYLAPEPDDEGNSWIVDEPISTRDALGLPFETWIAERERAFADRNSAREVATGVDRAVLVGLSEQGMPELAQLARAAGAEVVARLVQRRERPDPASFLGRGKAEDVALRARELGATVVVVDAELSGSQQAHLEALVETAVVDRPGLILDIFAQRARTREGKLQVELAQLNYLLPRLSGRGEALSRLGGGIGTRGPGETRLEVDRRRVRARIHHLEQELGDVRRHRGMQRRSRRSHQVCSLVGYTNAGKSTLLNAMTSSDVLVEDKLFATLDPTTRRLPLASGLEVLLTDTVGFVERLPHLLVAAFRATLEEVTEADLLIHVVDASQVRVREQMAAVQDVLFELEASDKPTLLVFNKIDHAQRDQRERLLMEFPEALWVSAAQRQGLAELAAAIEARLGDLSDSAVEPAGAALELLS